MGFQPRLGFTARAELGHKKMAVFWCFRVDLFKQTIIQQDFVVIQHIKSWCWLDWGNDLWNFGTSWIIPQVGLQPFPMNPPSPPPMTATEAEAAWRPAVVGSAWRKNTGERFWDLKRYTVYIRILIWKKVFQDIIKVILNVWTSIIVANICLWTWQQKSRKMLAWSETNGPPSNQCGSSVRPSWGGEVWKLHIFKDRLVMRSCGAGKIGNSGVSDYEVINLYMAL